MRRLLLALAAFAVLLSLAAPNAAAQGYTTYYAPAPAYTTYYPTYSTYYPTYGAYYPSYSYYRPYYNSGYYNSYYAYRPSYYGSYYNYRPYYGSYYGGYSSSYYAPSYSYSPYYSYYRPYWNYGTYGSYYYPSYYGLRYWRLGLNCGGTTTTTVLVPMMPRAADPSPSSTTKPLPSGPRIYTPDPVRSSPSRPEVADPGTFPYDGGPKDPVPMPRMDEDATLRSALPVRLPRPMIVEDLQVKQPAAAEKTGKWTYPAYGEAPRRSGSTSSGGGDRVLVLPR